ncbi:hypothetical protein ACRJ4B_24620 [Streptomyces sp. GTA36]|jgi:hypothetical protein|uniref:hypothetical protein n=1 Tax=Streptomyces TaxID=1883 RepID=UPI003AFB570B
MSSREHDNPREVAAPEVARSWLPALSGLSLGELSALDGTALRPSAERMRYQVRHPVSTIVGSEGG